MKDGQINTYNTNITYELAVEGDYLPSSYPQTDESQVPALLCRRRVMQGWIHLKIGAKALISPPTCGKHFCLDQMSAKHPPMGGWLEQLAPKNNVITLEIVSTTLSSTDHH